MKLREIKPGMVIHCKTEEEAELFYKWLKEKENITDTEEFELRKGIMNAFKNNYCFKKEERLCGAVVNWGDEAVEFSDLILPELSTEEVVEWMVNNYYKGDWGKCFGRDYTLDGLIDNFDTKEIIDRIANYIYEHKKKKTETEWVDICRIIEIQDNGTKKCVYEEEIIPDEELPYGSEKLKAEEIFKNYIAEHDGNYIAVIEPVLKVKGE